MKNTTEITVPLNCLTVSDMNVRRTPAGGSADAELKASLAAHGLLQNLVVHRNESIEGHYDVDAGRRRVTQLKELASEGVISEDFPVPCILIEDASMAVEVSLIENTMRADMHPADQVEASARLVSGGSTVAEIAMKFGMAERSVEQRLRLGNVAPVLLDAYREGKLNLETLTGFAVTPDQDLQLRVWRASARPEVTSTPTAFAGCCWRTGFRVTHALPALSASRLTRRRGQAYPRHVWRRGRQRLWLEDYALLYELAERKLAAAAEKISDSWRWVEHSLEFGYEDEGKFRKVFPTRGELTEDEQAEHDGLLDARDVILEKGV